MSTNKTKRSSLKNNSNLTPEEIEKLKAKSKRLSVKWNSSANLTYLDLSQKKVTNKVSCDSEKNKKFLENRRQSVKNEFTLVKEMLKNTDIQNELEDDEITKKNTKLNEKHDTSPGTDSSESSNEEE
jgi:cobalamin biosynthesis protein CobT